MGASNPGGSTLSPAGTTRRRRTPDVARAEILDAAERYTGGGEEAFRSLLYAPEMHDPDLLIRTSGEQRISNYLLWQAAYSELHFTDVLWPDFSRADFEHALSNLAEWQYIWVLFWFDRNEGWRPKVLPPRSRSGRKGVFATRSPHRPNPLGLSAVRLERVDGLTLHVSDIDMLDGKHVIDIKK